MLKNIFTKYLNKDKAAVDAAIKEIEKMFKKFGYDNSCIALLLYCLGAEKQSQNDEVFLSAETAVDLLLSFDLSKMLNPQLIETFEQELDKNS